MNRLYRILFGLICLESGVLLVCIPWMQIWERNFFLDRYPVLIPYLMNPFVRGGVTGLGLLDVAIAAGALLRKRDPDVIL